MNQEFEKETKKIPPYRLNYMMKVASKIADMILVPSQFTGSYDDAEMVLRIVAYAVGEARREGAKNE